jgi:hypothetical protein
MNHQLSIKIYHRKQRLKSERFSVPSTQLFQHSNLFDLTVRSTFISKLKIILRQQDFCFFSLSTLDEQKATLSGKHSNSKRILLA